MKESTEHSFILALIEQYGAAIEMIRKAITNCTVEIWNDRSLGTPFWQVTQHCLYFLDWYLSTTKDARESFSTPFPEIPEDQMEDEQNSYTKKEMIEYLDQIKRKAKNNLHSLTIETLEKSSVFEWHGSSVLSSLIYNLRHVMLHIGTLNLRLYNAGVEFASWTPHKKL